LKAENERLRAGGSEQVKIGAAQRQAKEAKAALNALELEVGSLRTRATAGEDAVIKLAQRQEQLTQAKRHLKQRDDDLKNAMNRADKAEQELQLIEEEARQASSKVMKLENDNRKLSKLISDYEKQNGTLLHNASSSSSSSSAGGHGSQRELLEEVEASRVEIERLRSVLASGGVGSSHHHHTNKASSSSGSSKEDSEALKALNLEYEGAKREIRRLQDRLSRSGGNNTELLELREENKKLREELSAFDMDFFEEIEDLKFKYAEAVRKLQRYE
jgi:chromosome segregation ATPase